MGTEGLLLRQSDYLDPDGSETLSRLREFEDLRHGVELLKRIARGPIDEVPRLGAFLEEAGLVERSQPAANSSSVEALQHDAERGNWSLYVSVLGCPWGSKTPIRDHHAS